MGYFAGMLLGTLYVPPPVPRSKQVRAAQHPNQIAERQKRRDRAMVRYRAAMNGGWRSTTDIAAALGMAIPNTYNTLSKWRKLKLVECRRVGNDAEWRFPNAGP